MNFDKTWTKPARTTEMGLMFPAHCTKNKRNYSNNNKAKQKRKTTLPNCNDLKIKQKGYSIHKSYRTIVRN